MKALESEIHVHIIYIYVDSPPCSPAGTFSPKRVKGFSGMEPGRCQHW